jgi:hypothetical protein
VQPYIKNLKEIHLEQIIIKLRRYFIVENVLNIPTVCYGKNIMIKDTIDKYEVFSEHKVNLKTNKEIVEYVNSLLECKTLTEYYMAISLKEHELELGDIIEFKKNGKKGVLTKGREPFYSRGVFYKPLKKDGTISKVLPRYIYGGIEYEKIGKYEGDVD